MVRMMRIVRTKSQKGFEPMTAIIIGTIVTLSFFALALPSIYTTRTIMRVIEYEYNYDNSQLVLISLLSNRDVYQRLSYYISGLPDFGNAFNREETEALLKSKLDILVESKCYRLTHGDVVIVKSLNTVGGQPCDPGYKTTAFIALPYGNDIGEIELRIG